MRSEQTTGAAQVKINLAQEALKAGQIEQAWNHLQQVLSRLSDHLFDSNNQALFVPASLEFSGLCMVLGRGFEELKTVLQRARTASKDLGDRRSLALINLHLGRLLYMSNQVSDAMEAFSAGKKVVEDLGDEDIRIEAAEFIGMYYFIQGRLAKARPHLEDAVRSLEAGELRGLIHPWAPVLLVHCAAYLGQFHDAIGMAEHYRQLALARSDRNLACMFQALLGLILYVVGNREDADLHLFGALEESRKTGNLMAGVYAKGGLSYKCFHEGRFSEARDWAAESLAESRASGLSLLYVSDLALETNFELLRLGAGHLPRPEFLTEVNRIVGQPSVHLRGVALRLTAMEAAARGELPHKLESLLESSEKYLIESGDPVQLAKTRVELARLKLRQGEHEKASVLVQKAWKGLAGCADFFYPDDLKHLLEVKSGVSLTRDPRVEILEMFVNVIRELEPSSDLNRLMSRVVGATSRFFGAERGGIFLFSLRGAGSRPTLRAGHNLSTEQVSDKEFSWSLTLVSKAYQENRPLVVRHEGTAQSETRVKAALCVPFRIEGERQGVLYHDNSQMTDCFEHFDISDLVRITNSLADYVGHLVRLNRQLERKTSAKLKRLWESNAKEIVTGNPLMLEMLGQVDQVATSDGTVLIMGETGVGKELVAYRLHRMSTRQDRPFVIVDPTTIPETLVESELFGYEKGAFTGADHQKTGRLELAHGGTLFIDEVGEIPKAVQVKLLRTLQEKTFVRVGGTRTLHSDFRLVAATNRDLAEEVAAGRFREDLYYRINVLPFTIPPLRERKGDIPLLARHFLARYATRYSQSKFTLKEKDEAELKAYDWPGNVRELEHVMERTVLLSTGEDLDFRLPAGGRNVLASVFSGFPTLDEVQRRYIENVLESVGGKISGPGGAAEILGMKRSTLDNRMRKLGLR
jgi:transcriptional regulator with GAF, ATPase, and Fis domain/predicted negative regulator of RcsB-dependent stress response